MWRNEEGLLTENYGEARRINAGSPEPLWTGGFNTELSWKGISLGIQLKPYGNKVLNQDRSLFEADGFTAIRTFGSADELLEETGRHQCIAETGLQQFEQQLCYFYPLSRRWQLLAYQGYYAGIQLAFEMDQKRYLLSGVRIYASALNLYTFHNMNYWDPDTEPRA